VRQLAEGADPDSTRVESFMSRPVTTLPVDASRGEIMQRMRIHGIRHIPLVDAEGNATRVATLDELLGEIGEELSDASAALRAEFHREIEKTRAGR
jgi:CBS domain-containing protein